MSFRTLLVGTDLTERSDAAILRGHDIARNNDARLVVCHVAPAQIGSHPLFPQRYEEEMLSAAHLDEQLAEAVSLRVAELTQREPDTFDVIIDQGEPARVLMDHAARLAADLTVVMNDGPDSDATVTRDLARSSSCSTLVVGNGLGTGLAVMALETEIATVPALLAAARAAITFETSKIVMILWVTGGEFAVLKWTSRLAELSIALGVTLEPRFAEIGDTSVVDRAATDPSIGLVALAAPLPDRGLTETSSPIDDALPGATSS